jgi:hypothetical protein
VNSRQMFLLAAAIGLIPVALSYGLQPATSLEFLFGVSVPDVNGTHLFRAIMGLYLAMVVYLGVEIVLGLVGASLLKKAD